MKLLTTISFLACACLSVQAEYYATMSEMNAAFDKIEGLIERIRLENRGVPGNRGAWGALGPKGEARDVFGKQGARGPKGYRGQRGRDGNPGAKGWVKKICCTVRF